MEEKKIAIVTNSSGDSGIIYSFNHNDEAKQFDHGKHKVGTMITFEFRAPHWAINRKEIQNKLQEVYIMIQ